MFTLARALQAIDDVWNAKPSSIALTWNSPVQFDESLVARLAAQHYEIGQRFETLGEQIRSHPADAEKQVLECADDLHKLRHLEALRLYPLIARGISSDPVARRLFWQSRLVMLGLARRLFRRFDELVRAIQSRGETVAAVDHVAKALAEYRQRNEAEIYPLYSLAGRRGAGQTHAA